MSDQGVKMWRYHVLGKENLWGVFLLDETGVFAAVSDFGNYACEISHHGYHDFREYFLKAKSGKYLENYLKKFRIENEFDAETTVKNIRQHILERRRERSIRSDEARTEWELSERLLEERNENSWYFDTHIEDATEFFVYDYPPSAKAFAYKLLPKLAELIEKDLIEEGVLAPT